MTFVTTKLVDGEAFAGPQIEAGSWEEAQAIVAEIPWCQIAGVLEHEHFQEPL